MKKIISAACAAAIAIPMSFAVPVSAANSSWQSDKEMTTLLSALDIMVGDDSGNYNLDSYVTRAEMAKIAVASSTYKNTVALGMKFSPFSDVSSNYWGAPYIQAAVSAGIVNGYIDGTFKPDGTVTYEEACTMMLKVLGYTDNDFGASYPYGQVGMAQNLKMTEGMNATIGQPLTRRQVGLLVCNSLDTAMTSTLSVAKEDLITAHNCKIIEDVTIIADQSEDSTLSSDEINTSNGKYRIRDNFDTEYIGSRGDLVVKDGKYFVAFSPDGTVSSEKYVIYSTLNDAILCYKEGNNNTMSEISISGTTKCYKDGNATTYAALASDMEIGDTIRVRYNDQGEIDYINYSKSSIEGPIKVTSSDWMNNFNTDSSTKIMRNGSKVNKSDIETNDIIYYSSTLDMVLAYSNKVTGVYESATPSKDMPQSVTVSGVTYEVEGVEAFNDLSSNGSVNYGDTVTLLMGRDGKKVAGVVTTNTVATETVTAYVIGSGKQDFTKSDNTKYTSYYVKAVTPDGVEHTYPVDYDQSNTVNKVAVIKVKDGKATVSAKSTSNSSLSGTVSRDNMTIGGRKVSSNVNIIDIAKNPYSSAALYSKVYMQRLDGLNLSSTQVQYYSTNENGEIDSMILQNATGDMYNYGIVTSRSQNVGFTIESDNSSYLSSTASLTVGSPVQFTPEGGNAIYASKLNSYSGSVSNLTQSTVEIGGRLYKLSDKVQVYLKRDTKYMKMSINDAISGSYEFTCYYDKSESEGGRIRIIIAQAK